MQVGVRDRVVVLSSSVTVQIEAQIARELNVREGQVRAAVGLLDDGATVPFVARYRKELTGGLDDAQLRDLELRLDYLRELTARRETVLEAIRGQGKLTDEVAARVMAADTKSRLEDIYLPFRQKRRTRAQIAREAGLEPLADQLLKFPATDPTAAAARFVDTDKGVADPDAALAGARSILSERIGEDADLIGELREQLWSRGRMTSQVRAGKEDEGAKFKDYFSFGEALNRLPSHRILALLRGEKEGVLDVNVQPEPEPESAFAGKAGLSTYESRMARGLGIRDEGRPGDAWLIETVRWTWRTRVLDRLEADLRLRLRQAAEEAAVRVFATNLRDLLLAAPAGARPTMGLDPGLRSGVKVAVVDATGKVVATDVIYPHVPQRRWDEALATLATLAARHGVELIAIGNGTASRETDKLAKELIAAHLALKLTKAVVSEAGASVYSASAYASSELPELDVTLRGAVSIARRLQDPLAELVKIDPKSIGVGQYQHDLPEASLARSLDAVVEDCVNGVGVDVNTASVPLLARVSGISENLAASIVAHRDEEGPFRSRTALKKVPRLGAKAFQQCAGFLRVADADDPLDSSSVHPEAYPVVRRIVTASGLPLGSLVGNARALHALRPETFVDDTFGLPTVTDIFAELEKPGRDPRPAFTTASFADGVDTVNDVRVGMVLEGAVTNVAAFGAFVDIGVHSDGLVHVSAMSRSFVKDPRDVVKSGDVVRVKVTSVDVARKRIGLTLRLDEDPVLGQSAGASDPNSRSDARSDTRSDTRPRSPKPRSAQSPGPGTRPAAPSAVPATGAMAEALRRAGLTGP
ncbi:MAG: RNA-binding transcriptional accessory protein [Pseudonocardiales bacterium]|nr:RNA-binding transcriptional accessory protein [Pseudonocardiales bacterium]